MAHSELFMQYTRSLSGSEFEPLNAVEERELLKKYYEGDAKALDRLVCAHLRFVIFFLRDYTLPKDVDIMDIIQEANIGLIDGIKRFNASKYNCRVFSYCFYWIRFYINRALAAHRKASKASGTFLGSDDDISTDIVAAEDEHHEQIAKDIRDHVFQKLTPIENTILSMFFGLSEPFQPKTLQEISSVLHMNLARVGQLKISALKKVSKQHVRDLI